MSALRELWSGTTTQTDTAIPTSAATATGHGPQAPSYIRKDIEFDADGTILRGWLYLPKDAKQLSPLIIMTHGWGAVKEIYLDLYAEAFARAGFAVLVYDNRHFGASDGFPRQEIDPWAQVRDYRHAITYARTLSEIDRERIGIWGTSYSGGHVLMVGAIDWRVKCVVAQCPTISGSHNIRLRFPGSALDDLHHRLESDRDARGRGERPGMIAITPDLEAWPSKSGSAGADVIKAFGNDGAAWFGNMRPDRLATWRNEVTLRTLDLYAEYEPGSYIERIGPTPLLLITGDNDTLTPTDQIVAAYQRAQEPKRLIVLPGGHYDLYGIGREAGMAAAREWFIEHLGMKH